MLEGSKIKLKNGKSITLVPLDGARVFIDTSNIAFIRSEKDENNEHIISISFEGNYTIKRGDKISFSLGKVNSVYEIEHIVVNKKGKSVILYSTHPTRTSLFILPVLGLSTEYLKVDSYFVNVYLDHTYRFLCLVYRFTGTKAYKEFEKSISSNPLYISHLEHGKSQVTYIMKIPDEFKNDIKLFIGGKYSKFSKLLKGRIRRFHSIDNNSYVMQVINRDKRLREIMENFVGMKLPEDSEVASKPDINIEIYKPYVQ